MRELIAIGIGSFGVNITDSMVQGMAEEHHFTGDAAFKTESVNGSYPHIFFDEYQSGKVTGRALLMDSDSMSINNVRAASGSNLYGLDNYFCGDTSMGSLYVKGRFGVGSELVNASLDKVRKLVERCDALQGFIVSYGLGGGTGSGMGACLLEKLKEEYVRNDLVTPILFPHKDSKSTVLEIYNAVLGMHTSIENADLALPYDMPAVNRYINRNFSLATPNLEDSNYLIG